MFWCFLLGGSLGMMFTTLVVGLGRADHSLEDWRDGFVHGVVVGIEKGRKEKEKEIGNHEDACGE